MNWTSVLAGALVLGSLVGCDADEGAPGAGAASAWIEVASASFADDGETEAVTIPAPGAVAALGVRVTSEPGVCFQLSGLVDAAGEVRLDGRSPGGFCRTCELRSSVAAEAGVFVFAAEQLAFAGEALSLRFARVDCETLTPQTGPEDRPPLRVDAQAIVVEPERGGLDLRLLIAADSLLAGDPDRQAAVVAALAEELSPAGLSPRVVEVVELEAAGELRFHVGDNSALAKLLAQAPAKQEGTIDVVVGGCLLYDDPVFKPAQAVQGYSPRIPGGAGPADAVFLPGFDCLAVGDVAIDLPAASQAHVLAHELGHYLGLYHAVEADGTVDQLDDTDEANLMHHRPGMASSVGLSPSQARVMRTHPSVRPD